jgi:hypothetical protein
MGRHAVNPVHESGYRLKFEPRGPSEPAEFRRISLRNCSDGASIILAVQTGRRGARTVSDGHYR